MKSARRLFVCFLDGRSAAYIVTISPAGRFSRNQCLSSNEVYHGQVNLDGSVSFCRLLPRLAESKQHEAQASRSKTRRPWLHRPNKARVRVLDRSSLHFAKTHFDFHLDSTRLRNPANHIRAPTSSRRATLRLNFLSEPCLIVLARWSRT